MRTRCGYAVLAYVAFLFVACQRPAPREANHLSASYANRVCHSQHPKESEGLKETVERHWKGQHHLFVFMASTNREDAELDYRPIPPGVYQAPCAQDESSICSQLSKLHAASGEMVLKFYTSNYTIEADERPSGIWAFYVESLDEELRQFRDVRYRPNRRAMTGQYVGKRPVGTWRLWALNGDLVGFTDFDLSNEFIACNHVADR